MKSYAEATFEGLSLRISANLVDDHIVRQISSSGDVYESDLLDLLRRVRQWLGGNTAIDVGAHIGNHTAVLGKALGFEVVAIEPDPELFAELESTIALNELKNQVKTLQAAAWAERPEGGLVYVAGESTNRGMGRVEPRENSEGTAEVRAIVLDEVVPASANVALIKVDTEGSEAEVLKGATRILREQGPLVVAEIHDGSSARRLQEHLPGYTLSGVFGATPICVFVHDDHPAELSSTVNGWSHLQSALVQGRLDSWRQRAGKTLEAVEGATRRLGQDDEELRLAIESAEANVSSEFQVLRESLQAKIDGIEGKLDRLTPLDDSLAALAEIQQYLKAQQSREEKEREAAGRRLEAAVIEDLRIIRQLDSANALRFARIIREAQAKGLRGWLRLPGALLAARRNAALGTEFSRYEGAVSQAKGVLSGESASNLDEFAREAPVLSHTNARPRTGEPLVSVIITAFNAEEHLRAAVRSISSQTYRHLEIIVIDDASTDETEALLADLARDEPRLRYIRMLENRGTYFCKNVGIVEARGDLLTFNDADDQSHGTRIEQQVAAIRSSLNKRMAVCDYQRIDDQGRVVLNRGLQSRLALQCVLFDRSLVEEMGFFDSVRISADAEFFARFVRYFGRQGYVHLREPLYFALARPGALSTSRGQEASLGQGDRSDASQPLSHFLSADRAQYQRNFEAWHRGTRRPHIVFPMRRRTFEAPAPHAARTLSPSRVIAGMATIEARRSSLPAVIESLMPQVDELHIHLNDYATPPTSDFGGKVRYTTYESYGDRGDNAKFLPSFDVDEEAYRFTVDDDIVYPRNYVRRLQTLLDRFNREIAVGVHGIRLPAKIDHFYKGRSVAHFKRECEALYAVDLIGSGTLAWHDSAFRVAPEDIGDPGMADLWFGIACRRSGVPRVIIDRSRAWLQELPQDTSIWATGQRDDTVQTRVAAGAGAWGTEALESEMLGWRPDLAKPNRRASLGFRTDRLALPDRSW